jgi:hypothetical protein
MQKFLRGDFVKYRTSICVLLCLAGYGIFPAGSRVSLIDPDAGKTLTPFKAISPPIGWGGPTGDLVYFHVGAGGAGATVSPNDIRPY